MSHELHLKIDSETTLDVRCIYRRGAGEEGTGWNVVVQRKERKFRKYFPDWKFKGEEGALAAAQAWRDKIEKLHPKASKQEVMDSKGQSTPSGRLGVTRVYIRSKVRDGGGTSYPVWKASAPRVNGSRKHSKCFSVIKYGEKQAFKLAVAARKAFEAERATELQQPYKSGERRTRTPEMRNLQRQTDMEGWQVDIKYRRLGQSFIKSFADSNFGGQDQSLKAAQAWRDEIVRLHPSPTHKERAGRPMKTNKSGIAGVYLLHYEDKRADGSSIIRTYWSAHTPGRATPRRTRLFSIEKHGEREAFRMAVEARKAFEDLLDD
ncbi:AP2 domain-containing protein [Serratia fonticola]|uniref:AP2 domain-containing protein n=1 Tax=Serratia fonticola TaxID=47917 RepID=UPI002177219C|nr:AP2 domain-containing protein [Serratia fonticola]CAI1728973.1 AP2 domain [Serratia fonticola]